MLYRDAVAENGRNLKSKHQIQPECGERERDCRSRETKFSGANRNGEKKNFLCCSADHKQVWQPYPFDPYSAESADLILYST